MKIPLSMDKRLSEKDMQMLMQRGLLGEGEIAFKEGGLIIAENLLTGQRRVLNVTGLILEANKHLLKD